MARSGKQGGGLAVIKLREHMRQRILMVVLLGLVSFSTFTQVFATTLTLSPTVGNVGQTISASGTGYTPTGITNQTVPGTDLSTTQSGTTFVNNMFADQFTGLPSGNNVTALALKINKTGTGIANKTFNYQSNSGTANFGENLYGNLWTSGNVVLPAASTITNVTLDVTATGSQPYEIRLLVYDYGSGALIGNTSPFIRGPTDTGFLSFPASINVVAHTNVIVAFETNSSVLRMAYGSGSGALYKPNTYGNTPSNYYSATGWDPWYENVHWVVPTPTIRVKIYNDTSGNPSNLLGESGSYSILSPGIVSVPVNAIIPNSGKVWGAYQIYAGNMSVYQHGTGGGGCLTAANYGSGPNPFGTCSSWNTTWETLSYDSNPGTTLNFTWDGSLIPTIPTSPAPNSTGGFSGVTFTASPSLIGSHTIEAEDTHGLHASNSFTITIPTVTSTINGNVIFDTSSVTPSLSYSAPPYILDDIRQILVRNGTTIQTITSPTAAITGGTPTNGNVMGEVMPSNANYYINTTMFDGANSWIVQSNTIALSKTSNASNGKVCSIAYCPSQTLVNYTAHRTPDYKTLIMTVNLLPIPFHIECNIINGTFQNHHKWFNYTNVNAVNFSTPVPYNDNAYYGCYGSGLILSGVSPGNGTLVVQGANVFNQTIGVTLGVPIGTFFIALLASLANQRTGPIYVVVVLGATGVMSALLFFTVPSGAWALEIITGFLGLFVGRKIY